MGFDDRKIEHASAVHGPMQSASSTAAAQFGRPLLDLTFMVFPFVSFLTYLSFVVWYYFRFRFDGSRGIDFFAGGLATISRRLPHLYRRAIAIAEKSYGPDHPKTKIIRENLRSLQGQDAK
jgi:hypothetical protein